MTHFVDTNIFLRFMAADDEEKAARCLALFEQAAQGEIDLVTSEVIVAEVVYVYSSRSTYKHSPIQVAEKLTPLLEIESIRIENKASILAALELYADSNLDFEDCLAIEHTKRLRLDGIFSYDRKLGRAHGVNRLEP